MRAVVVDMDKNMKLVKSRLVFCLLWLLNGSALADDLNDKKFSPLIDAARKAQPIDILGDDPNYERHLENVRSKQEASTPPPLSPTLSEPRTIVLEAPVVSAQSKNLSQVFMFEELSGTDDAFSSANIIPLDLRQSQVEVLRKAATRKLNP
jgi:hypothetical protein